MDLLLPLLLVVAVMWLMTSRNRKQQRAAADFRANLAVGQEVMTGSGLFGTIVAVDGDTITLESTPGSRTRWIRAAIAKLVPPPEEAVEDDETLAEDDAALGTGTAGATAMDLGPDRPLASGGLGADATPADEVHRADDHIDVPDDLSTLDERRPGEGPERR
jgi:preprotein translocase subunit YajC